MTRAGFLGVSKRDDVCLGARKSTKKEMQDTIKV